MVAPLGALPALAVLDLTACPRLGYLFVQAPLLHTLLLDQCAALGKARRRPRPAGPRAWPGTARTAHSPRPRSHAGLLRPCLAVPQAPVSAARHWAVAAQAVIYCKRLDTLRMGGCAALGVLLLWSDRLTELSLLDSTASSQPAHTFPG